MVGKAIQFEPTGPLSLDDYDLLVEAGRPGVDLVNVWEDGRDRTVPAATLSSASGHVCAGSLAPYIISDPQPHFGRPASRERGPARLNRLGTQCPLARDPKFRSWRILLIWSAIDRRLTV